MTIYQKELDLKRMGYRLLKDHVWAKPIGYMLFSFHMLNNSIQASFFDSNGKGALWTSDTYTREETQSFLHFIKGFECYTRTDIAIAENSQFHFLTQEEYYDTLLMVA